jgi:hypothetical protein
MNLQSVFELLDAFAMQTGLREFTVAPSHSVFTPLYDAISNDIIAKHPRPRPRIIEVLWRNVNGSYILPIHSPETESFFEKYTTSWPKPPQPGYRTIRADQVGVGYWLTEGDVDNMPVFVCTMCTLL